MGMKILVDVDVLADYFVKNLILEKESISFYTFLISIENGKRFLELSEGNV